MASVMFYSSSEHTLSFQVRGSEGCQKDCQKAQRAKGKILVEKRIHSTCDENS